MVQRAASACGTLLARGYNREHAKEITGDFDLVEQLSEVVTSSYGRASGQVHTTATREQAYRALKQWESIFAQLVPAGTPDGP